MPGDTVTNVAAQAPSRGTIQRPRVLAKLDATAGSRLVLVVAGPGYGKTTVLTQWASANRTAWISVLPKDRGFGGLARALLRALDALSPGIEVELRPVVASWSPEIGPHEAAWALVDLLNDVLGREPGHMSLIVDDVAELAQQDTAWDL